MIFGKPKSFVKRSKAVSYPFKQFHAIVGEVRNSGHRTAKDAGNTIEFLAYLGARIGEARRVLWGDRDFVKGEITIKGDPVTGTKNWNIRTIPMIPAQRVLLKGMKKDNPSAKKTDTVLRVSQVRGSLGRPRSQSARHTLPTMTYVTFLRPRVSNRESIFQQLRTGLATSMAVHWQ
jgi:integrase